MSQNNFDQFQDLSVLNSTVTDVTPLSVVNSGEPSALVTIVYTKGQKIFRKEASYKDGTLEKVSNANIADFSARTERLTLKQLHQKHCNDEFAIIPGTPIGVGEGQSLTVLSKTQFEKKHPQHFNPPYVVQKAAGCCDTSRLLDTFESSNLICLDYDADKHTPPELRFHHPQFFINKLSEEVFPELADVSFAATFSSSAGIRTSTGLQLTDSYRHHSYFIVKNAKDIVRFRKVFKARLILAGLYWLKQDINGHERKVTLVDLMPMSPNSLVFEGKTILKDGLLKDYLPPILHQGLYEVLDTEKLLDLPPEDLETLAGKVGMQHLVKHPSGRNLSIDDLIDIERTSDQLKRDMMFRTSDDRMIKIDDIPNELKRLGVDKLTGYSPLRDDKSPGCFVSVTSKGIVFLHDCATRQTHFCAEMNLPILFS